MSEQETLYARWLSGDLSAEELEQLKASGELAELEAIVHTLEQSKLPGYDADQAYAAFKNNQPAKKEAKVRRLSIGWMAGIAAGFLLLLATFFWLYSRPTQLMAAPMANASTTLPDGSNVLVNDGSSITYQSATWEKERVVELEGEAFFQVETGMPFEVQTKNGRVRVLGTQFNVRAWGDRLYVECYEGSVEVISKTQDRILEASESVLSIQGDLQPKVSINHQGPTWASKDGHSRFFNAPFVDVFAELERQYGVTVDAPELSGRSFPGQFAHNDLDVALQEICKPFNLTYIISPDQKTVTVRENG